jgi:protein-disulfide isomerase
MQEDTVKVLVIGTNPPCPRCDLLARRVREVAAEGDAKISVRHCAFDANEATAIGQRLGYKLGTAKHVAEAAGIQMDWDAVHGLINRKNEELGPEAKPADRWTPQFDQMLEPCRQVAESVGYLMTPIVVINGIVKHYGNVPTYEQLRSWILE